MTSFEPPPYPYDELHQIVLVADQHPGGAVDLSVGTPCDPAPAEVVGALSKSGAEHGYPSSVGAPALREAATQWLKRRFGVTVGPSQVAACVGTKEFVASAAHYLRLRHPERDVVFGPAIAYPTYAMGAMLAECRYVGIGASDAGDLDFSTVDEGDAKRGLLLWLNSPNNPTGAVFDLQGALAWAEPRGITVISDECYSEFTWGPRVPETVLEHSAQGVLALHSLSKRSNLAGLRLGFYAGDPALVGFLSEIRKHAGLMVPAPVQAAGVVALDDDAHVEDQRGRYLGRLRTLASALARFGLPASLPAGGFYLWVAAAAWASSHARADERGAGWALAEELARSCGMVVSPGAFYGQAGIDFVRIAAVAPDDRIDMLAKRLERNGLGSGNPRLS